MPILFSQLLAKPWLYLVALANALLLIVLAVLLFLPPDPLRAFLPPSNPAALSAENASNPSPHTAAPSMGARMSPSFVSNSPYTGDVPSHIMNLSQLSHESAPASDSLQTVQAIPPGATSPFESSQSLSDTGRQPVPALAANNTNDSATSGASLPESAIAYTTAKPQDISVPLAFTTPDDGAMPSQQAALERLRSEFASTVGDQGADPNSAAYARLWRQEQATNDSTYEQQFGTEAFIEAQLLQVHSGAN